MDEPAVEPKLLPPPRSSSNAKKILISLLVVFMLASGTMIAYLFGTKKITLKNIATEQGYKSFYFIPEDRSYEAIFVYKWEYPKLLWRFEKLTTEQGKSLVQRRFLHIGQTEEEVRRQGWIDQSFIEWSPGEPLPSGEINIPTDKGCWFQLDVTMTVKPQFGQTNTETSSTFQSERVIINNCLQVPPTATPTLTPTLTPSPTPTGTVTPTVTPSVSPTLSPTPGQTSCSTLQAYKVTGSGDLTLASEIKAGDVIRFIITPVGLVDKAAVRIKKDGVDFRTLSCQKLTAENKWTVDFLFEANAGYEAVGYVKSGGVWK
jgi:hypothetical protein